MGTKTTDRQELIEKLNNAMRQQSTWTVMFHNAIAGQVGLNITDHKCLDILMDRGALTAGQLAEITGLTTGAVTGVIDRLEKAGFVQRGDDPADRRRVMVQPALEKAGEELGPFFAHFQQRYMPLLESHSDDELRLVLRFVEESIGLIQEEIGWLRQKPGASKQ